MTEKKKNTTPTTGTRKKDASLMKATTSGHIDHPRHGAGTDGPHHLGKG